MFVACASIIVQLTSQREIPSGFRTFWCGQWGTHQNGGVDANLSMRFRLQGKRMPLILISVDRALVHQTLSVNRSITMSDVCERYRYRAVVVPCYTGYRIAFRTATKSYPPGIV